MHRPLPWTCLVLAAVGCNNLSRHTTGIRELHPGKADVPIYKIGQAPPRPYEVLGKVYVEDKINLVTADYTEEQILQQFRPAVAAVGADAVVGFHSSHAYGAATYQRWASGLAVRWREASRKKEPVPLPPYAVSITEPLLLDETRSWRTATGLPLAEQIKKGLQTQLEAKGYYALLPEEAAAGKCPLVLDFDLNRAVNGAVHM